MSSTGSAQASTERVAAPATAIRTFKRSFSTLSQQTQSMPIDISDSPVKRRESDVDSSPIIMKVERPEVAPEIAPNRQGPEVQDDTMRSEVDEERDLEEKLTYLIERDQQALNLLNEMRTPEGGVSQLALVPYVAHVPDEEEEEE
eukprot:6460638-Amphidinium_carterae.1